MSGPPFSRLAARDPATHLVNVVVETPAGSRSKFRFDEELGVFRLHKMLPAGASFPFDFGFVPGTRADDGDPLDVMVLGAEPTFTGCLLTVRLLGVIEAEQREKGKSIRNDRLLAVPETAKIRPRERSLADLPAGLVDGIEHFFVSYNHFEGRVFVILRRSGARAALRQVEEAVKRARSSITVNRRPSRPRRSGGGSGATPRRERRA